MRRGSDVFFQPAYRSRESLVSSTTDSEHIFTQSAMPLHSTCLCQLNLYLLMTSTHVLSSLLVSLSLRSTRLRSFRLWPDFDLSSWPCLTLYSKQLVLHASLCFVRIHLWKSHISGDRVLRTVSICLSPI